MIATRWKTPLLLGVITSPLFLAACSQTTSHGLASRTDTVRSRPYSHTAKDKECLQRAMFFESNRSSRDGMIAVGTVVMNRLRSGKHGNTICEVVGERGQFAPGVMTRPMNSKAMPDVEEAAEAVLKGERKAKLKNSMFFHTAGLRFPYKNMHYTMVAGGNAFYEKRGRNWKPLPDEPTVAMAQSTPRGSRAAPVTLMASAAPAAKAEFAKATYVTAVASQPAKATPQKATFVAMQEPDATRFGGIAGAQAVTSFPAAPAEPTMASESTPENTDAIGAMIAGQGRPLETY
ncbi:MAG: cell wall hydrolase [Mesorhizobium sp.]|nr:MAG: cell wall hydrolase [Mesorhizobium sp.]